MSTRMAILVVLVLGAITLGWLQLRDSRRDDAAASAPGRSAYVLRDFELVTLNGEGVESFSLRAPELRQTPGARSLELATPLFLMPDQDGNYWEIRSRSGEVSEDSSLIQLRDEVVAISPGSGDRRTTVTTDSLNVYPNESRAATEAAVIVVSPGTTMRGTGMQANLADRDKRIQLLSEVGITYEPRTR